MQYHREKQINGPVLQKDMSRAEELATELRTLRYDHERIKSMHNNAAEKAANFEREMNVHKSKLK